MKPSILASLALAASAIPAVATAQIPDIGQQSTLLTVSADGDAARKPDMAIFTAGVTSTGKTASEALSANSADMAKVIAALKRSGIAERVSFLNLQGALVDEDRAKIGPVVASQRQQAAVFLVQLGGAGQ